MVFDTLVLSWAAFNSASVIHRMHDLSYREREVAVGFALELRHLGDEDKTEVFESLLVVVDLYLEHEKIGQADAVVAGMLFDGFVEHVDDLA
jgi:hypothetical protein